MKLIAAILLASCLGVAAQPPLPVPATNQPRAVPIAIRRNNPPPVAKAQTNPTRDNALDKSHSVAALPAAAPSPYATNFVIAWDDAGETNFFLYLGSNYNSFPVKLGESTNCVRVTWDARVPLWAQVTAYSNVAPYVVYQWFGYPWWALYAVATNSTVESAPCGPLLAMPALAPPIGWVSNGTAFFAFYGASNVDYTIVAGSDLNTWEPVVMIEGTNGQVIYAASFTNSLFLGVMGLPAR